MAHAGGRPTILTPELIAEFGRVLPTLLYLDTAANLLNVGRITWREWIKRGNRELKRVAKGGNPDPAEALFVEFLNMHKSAVATGDWLDLDTIQTAARTQWQAAAWRQERRHPEKWSSFRAELRALERTARQQEEEIRDLRARLAQTAPGSQPARVSGAADGHGTNGHH